MIYGERIRFRSPEREDLPMFTGWINDPEVRFGISMFLPMSLAREEQWFENMLFTFYDYVALLEPTCPLRETSDIDKSVELLIDNKVAESIVGVKRLEGKHPEFNIVIDKESGLIKKANGAKEFKALRRQELSDIYHYDGTIYISKASALKAKKTFYHELTMAYVVPNWRSLGIDDLSDFICVEALLKHKLEVKSVYTKK